MVETTTRQKQNQAIRAKVETTSDGRLLRTLSLDELENLMINARGWLIENKKHRGWTYALRKFSYIQKIVQVKKDAPKFEHPELYENVMLLIVYTDY